MSRKVRGWRSLAIAAVAFAIAAAAAGMASGLLPTTSTSSGPHTVESGQTLDLGDVFGNTRPVEITGKKYEDLNGNGVRDPGEPALASIVIRLSGVDGMGHPVSLTTTTDSNGVFRFAGLMPGTYTVAEELPSSPCNWTCSRVAQ